MIDIKKYICLFILNNFGLFTNSNFTSDEFKNKSQISFGDYKANIFGSVFNKDDFKLSFFAADTFESKEYHCLLKVDNKNIFISYNKQNYLICSYENEFINLSLTQTISLLNGVILLKELFITPIKEEISDSDKKLLISFIKHSMDIFEA